MVKDARKTVQRLENDDKRALRDGFGDGMLILGEKDPRVVALCADLTESDRLVAFRGKWPERFVEMGVAEQNMIGVAAGMAHAGKVPFTASFAVFSPGRSWDQVRVSVCYSANNVKLYGGHAGLTVGEDGATHQALEDIAITRVLPRMIVLVPADAIEMRKATLAAARLKGPVYLRGGREKQAQVTTDETPFEIGHANLLRDGKDVTIIACGIMVREALLAAKELAGNGVEARVLDMHTIKPLDEDAILAAASETGAIVTAEEHQVIGGLGSAVAETLGAQYPVPMEFVGVKDTFGESGTASALLDKYGLLARDIVAATMRVLERKKRGGKMAGFAPSGKDVRKLPKAATTARKVAPSKQASASAKSKAGTGGKRGKAKRRR